MQKTDLLSDNMPEKKKVLLAQIQLAGAGFIIMLFSFITQRKVLFWLGLAVVAYGMIRFVGFKSVIAKLEQEENQDFEDR